MSGVCRRIKARFRCLSEFYVCVSAGEELSSLKGVDVEPVEEKPAVQVRPFPVSISLSLSLSLAFSLCVSNMYCVS